MARDDLRLSPAWAAVLLPAAGMAGAFLMYVIGLKYATKEDVEAVNRRIVVLSAQVDSTKMETRGLNSRFDLWILRRIPDDVRPDHHDRAGRRPTAQEVYP